MAGTTAATELTVTPAELTITDDEVSTKVALSMSLSSVAEDASGTSVTVTGTLNAAARTTATTVTVSVGAAGDDATAGTDYATVSDFTLTILAGQTTGTASFTLTPTDDAIDEEDETLTVTGTTAATELTVDGSAVTITDDDARGVTVSTSALNIDEGASDEYTVVLTSQPTADVTVSVTVPSGTDVSVDKTSLTFTASNWSTAQTVTVSAAQDADARGDRATVTHAVAGGDYGAVTADAVAVTVVDDEAPGQVTGVTVSADIGQLAVTWDAVSNADGYKVQWKSGSETFADAATDNREATISSGTTTSYAITGLTNGTAYSVQVIATRANADDGMPSATETGTPVARARITSVEFTNVPSSGVYGLGSTIEVSVRFNAAVEVTGRPQIQLIFVSTMTFNKYVRYDAAASTDRVLVFKRLVSGDDDDDASGVRVAPNGLGGGTIKNKGTSVNADRRHGSLVGPNVRTRSVKDIAVTSKPVAGGLAYGPGEKIEFTVTFEYRNRTYVDQTGGNPQLFFQARNSSTTYAAAYESGTGTGELVFAWTVPAAVADDGADLVVPTNVDELSAGFGLYQNRGLVLNGGTISNSSGDAVNIRHGEYGLGVQVDTTPPALASGAAGATVNGATLVLAFQDPNNSNLPDQLDENSVPTETDFAVTVAGSAQTVSSVDISGATATLNLASPVGYAQTVTVDYTPGTNPIQDLKGNDAASITGRSVRNDSPQPSLSIQDATVAEGAGTAAFAVALDVASGEQVAVNYATADGTGAAGSDYTAASGTLTFAAGETTKTIEVAVADDAIDEENEDFTVTLSNPVTATIADATATGTITDNDTRGIEVSSTDVTVAEGESDAYTVVLSSQPTSAVTVTPSASGDADVTVSPSTLTFRANNWSTAQTVTVSAAQDADADDDAATITHAVAGGDYGSVAAADVAVTVSDDETASTKVTLSVSASSVDEDADATSVTVTGTLDEAARTTATTVTVSVGASGDSATEGIDYATANDEMLTIAAGQTTGTASFTLTPTDDDVDEEAETLTVDGTAQGLTVTPTSVTIADNDTRGIAVSSTDLTVAEGRSKSYTVVLSSQPTADVTVTPNVSGDSDVTVAPSTLTFTTSNWSTAQTATVSAAQDADADDDAATIAHAVSGGDYGAVTADDVAVTVTDDETASTKVTLSVNVTSVSEDAGAHR